MKKYFLKPVTLKLALSFLIILVAIVIHSCRKDSKSDTQSSPAVTAAKSWYESVYPVKSSVNSKQITQSTEGHIDLSQLIKPDWQHTVSYIAGNKNVIEMPVDPGAKFASTFKIGKKSLNKAYSRSYYLLMNDGKKYDAYILTIVADSAYVKNDLSKLSHNTFRKQDADFSGLALYFTPKGNYLGGYAYKDGKVVTPATATQQTGGQHIQSVNNGNLKPEDTKEICIDWYQQSSFKLDDGSTWYSDFTYMGTSCTTIVTDGTTPGTTPGNSPGTTPGSGSPSLSSPPPPPCPPGSSPGTPVTPPCVPPTGTLPQGITTGKLKVDFMPLPGSSACSVNIPAVPCVTITNNIIDPCLKKMVDASISSNIEFKLKESMNSIFNSNTDFNLNFIDKASTALVDPNEDGETVINGTGGYPINDASGNIIRTITTSMDITIILNKTALSNPSKEYVTATIIHEALHAYLTYSHTIIDQHQDMLQNYLSSMSAQLIKMYPNLIPADANALAWGGLEKDNPTAYNSLSTVDKNHIALANLYFKTGQKGTPCN